MENIIIDIDIQVQKDTYDKANTKYHQKRFSIKWSCKKMHLASSNNANQHLLMVCTTLRNVSHISRETPDHMLRMHYTKPFSRQSIYLFYANAQIYYRFNPLQTINVFSDYNLSGLILLLSHISPIIISTLCSFLSYIN